MVMLKHVPPLPRPMRKDGSKRHARTSSNMPRLKSYTLTEPLPCPASRRRILMTPPPLLPKA
jgi:hypothetical protein